MGLGMSFLYPVWSRNQEDIVCRIMTYNVEWGFLNLPSDIKKDSCGHTIPQTSEAQKQHLCLIAKNIGLINPDICFLQEMGSLDAVKYIGSKLSNMFGLEYTSYYSNDETGYQGVGLLIKSSLVPYCNIDKIPNFPLNRALGITFTKAGKEYKLVGVHLKSLYDHNYAKDIPEQLAQLAAVNDWIGTTENSIVCGDMNNTPNSKPMQKMTEYGYKDILDTDAYVPNIVNTTDTEFHGKSGKESGSRIDYIYTSKTIKPVSGHIVNFVRENENAPSGERKETSDHLPLLGIFKF